MDDPLGNLLEDLVEPDSRLSIQRLRQRLIVLADANRIHNHKVRLVLGVGCYALKVVGIDDAYPSALHLLKVRERPDIPHEEQALQCLHIRARRNHVHRNRDARVERVPELG